MKEKIIILVGPTASGKTNVSIELAKKINAEIISADSMQIYKHMNIGTAKPTSHEMEGIVHYLIDEIDPAEEFSVALFRQLCEGYIEKIVSKGKKPLIVGGTGLYINSLVKPWNFSKTEPNRELRYELETIAKDKGKEHLHNMLRRVDPLSADAIHPNNVKRVIRALEVFQLSGMSKSESDQNSMREELTYEPIIMGIHVERSILYDRIEKRIDSMLDAGLVEEVKALLGLGYKESLVSMQGLGYKEIVKYLKGEYTYNEAVEILKRDTRHFAKRQLTWFRRDDRIKWFTVEDYENLELLQVDMYTYLKNKGI